MGWVDSLKGNVIGLDTTPLIYFTEENPTYIEVIDPFFKAVGSGELTVVTSIVTLLEVLVRPIRDGNLKLAQSYRDFLLNSNSVTTRFLSRVIAEEAASYEHLITFVHLTLFRWPQRSKQELQFS
jgi:hypothetical protein